MLANVGDGGDDRRGDELVEGAADRRLQRDDLRGCIDDDDEGVVEPVAYRVHESVERRPGPHRATGFADQMVERAPDDVVVPVDLRLHLALRHGVLGALVEQ